MIELGKYFSKNIKGTPLGSSEHKILKLWELVSIVFQELLDGLKFWSQKPQDSELDKN